MSTMPERVPTLDSSIGTAAAYEVRNLYKLVYALQQTVAALQKQVADLAAKVK